MNKGFAPIIVFVITAIVVAGVGGYLMFVEKEEPTLSEDKSVQPIEEVAQPINWVQAFFPDNYKHSVEIWHPTDWFFSCCGDKASESNHSLYPPGSRDNLSPRIIITDYVLIDPSKSSIELPVEVTPTEKIELLRQLLSANAEELENRFLEGLGVEVYVYRVPGGSLEHPLYPGLNREAQPSREIYLINTGDDVVAVTFENYERFDSEFIVEFLNRIQPGANTTADWQTYRNDAFKYELRYPSNFNSGLPDYLANLSWVDWKSFVVFLSDNNSKGISITVAWEDSSRFREEISEPAFSKPYDVLHELDAMITDDGVKVWFTVDEFAFIISRQPASWREPLEIGMFDKILSTFKFIKDPETINIVKGFSPETVTANDNISGFIVNEADYENTTYYSVSFTGSATVTGKIKEVSDVTGDLCFEAIDHLSQDPLPRSINENTVQTSVFFCFVNHDFALEQLLGKSAATIVIDEINERGYRPDTYPAVANLVEVISVE